MLTPYYGKHGINSDCATFRSKGFDPNWGIAREPISMEGLPPFLRTLLVTDGTVTKSLEAYYWDPITVLALSQEFMIAEADLDWLDVRVGDEVLGRRVNLQGAGRKTYAKAFSVIRSSMVPQALRRQLLAGRLGIGELIRDCGLETYRELLEIGNTTKSNELDAGDAAQGGVFRTYRILLGGKPMILVTEHFLIETFR